jgi:N utilization substance protein A
VIVPDFQLSLAIGKEGQNARLAARLTGWRVDIRSENQPEEEPAVEPVDYAEGEWVQNAAGDLVWQPAEGGEAISAADAGYGAGAPGVPVPPAPPAAPVPPAEPGAPPAPPEPRPDERPALPEVAMAAPEADTSGGADDG